MRVRIIAVWTAVAVGVLLTVAAPPAGAVTLNTASVDCTGNPSALSNALAQATDVGGRWVLTTSGTCTGPITVNPSAVATVITVTSAGGATLTGGPMILTVNSGVRLYFTNMTITGGTGTPGVAG